MTTIIGLIADKYDFNWVGKRKFYYIFGFIIEVVSFIMIYRDCLLCSIFNNYSFEMRFFYYSLFPALFNFGWAMVEVSHMALGPMLTCSRSRRDKLNNLRNTFSYIS
jgi:Na+/melibiose symporter-like transporter